jgi:hypothetical protein
MHRQISLSKVDPLEWKSLLRIIAICGSSSGIIRVELIAESKGETRNGVPAREMETDKFSVKTLPQTDSAGMDGIGGVRPHGTLVHSRLSRTASHDQGTFSGDHAFGTSGISKGSADLADLVRDYGEAVMPLSEAQTNSEPTVTKWHSESALANCKSRFNDCINFQRRPKIGANALCNGAPRKRNPL